MSAPRIVDGTWEEDARWYPVLPKDDGQLRLVSYGTCEGAVLRRVYDQADGSWEYYRGEIEDDDLAAWDPLVAPPKVSEWRRLET